jgi:hypothetical protein
MDERGEGLIQFRWSRRFVPEPEPAVAVLGRKRRGKEPGQELQRCDAKIRAWPVDGYDGVLFRELSNLGRSNDATASLAPYDGQPRVSQQVEHEGPCLDVAVSF